MSPVKPESKPTTSTHTTKPAEAEKAPSTSADEKVKGKKPLTIMVPEKLWKQLRLLSSVEGVTLSNIFLSAVEKTVPARLERALAAIKTDAEK